MKIGFYNPYLDSLGGGERYILTAAETLSQTHEVYIFWDDKRLKKKINERLAINLEKIKFTDNIFTRGRSLLEKLVLSSKYDLIFFLSDGSIPSSLARKNILHFQCPFPHVKGKSFFNRIKLRRFQIIICNSKFTKKYIDQEYNVDSVVLSPPVEVGKFRPGEKKNLIISVGRFSKYFINKRQKEMVKFFKNLSLKLPGWKLYLVGSLLNQDREYFEEVKSLIDSAPIKLLPNEPFGNLKKYYAESKIYWHAAGFGEDEKTNPAGMEHFGISTVEAMAAGCVPIVFDGGGLREIVDHGKDGFLWRSEEELIDYTLRLVSDEELRIRMADRAVKRSRKFSKKKFCQEIKRLIKEIFCRVTPGESLWATPGVD